VSISPQIQTLIDRLAGELGQSVLFEDNQQIPVSWSTLGEVDATRMKSILNRTVAPAAAAVLERYQLARATAPIRTPAMPQIEMWARWCMPARHEGHLYGYLWVLDPTDSIDADGLGKIAECAAAAAATLARSRHSSEQIDRVRAELLDRLLKGPDGGAVRELVRTEHVGHDALIQVEAPAAYGGWALPDDMSIHVLTGRPRQATSGKPVPLLELATAVQRAAATRRALRAGARLRAPVWHELGAWRLVVDAPGDLMSSDLHPGVRALTGPPRGDLLATARSLVDHGGDATAAAAELHIHRATLYYRVGRIKDLTGVDLLDGASRIDVQLALWLDAYRAAG
jgi:hypothetical protein